MPSNKDCSHGHEILIFYSTVIPRSTFFIFDSVEEPSITAVDGSLHFKRRGLLSLLVFIKLFLNHLRSSSDDVSNVLITDSFFSFTLYIVVSSALKEGKKVTQMYIEQQWTKIRSLWNTILYVFPRTKLFSNFYSLIPI